MTDSKLLSNRSHLIVLLGTLLVALNLRPAIASVSPVLEAIRTDLSLSYATASLLTTIPTLCMGVFAFLTIPVVRRIGRDETILASIVLIALATGARLAGQSVIVLFLSTLLVGVGIAVAQTLLPSLVQEYFSDNAGLVTGLYTMMLISGAALSAGLTAPISFDIANSWTLGLGIWAIPAVGGIIAWLPVVNGTDTGSAEPTVSRKLPWLRPWAWFLVCFFAGSSALFFSVLAWLSPLYVDLNWGAQQAGFVLTAFTVSELGGSLGTTFLTNRFRDRRPPLVLMLSTSSVGLAGAAIAPLAFPWLWAVLMGIGIGGTFALVLTLPVDHATSPEATERLTAMVFGVGYTLAAAGPYVVGKLRSLSTGFEIPFLVLAAISVTMLVSSLALRPSRTIDA